jgi:hypothetical protein
MVEIQPVSSTSLTGLPAGAHAKPLRVHGVITGTPQPATPVWSWKVLFLRDGSMVAFTVDPDDPSIIDVPLALPGNYDIQATVSTSPLCQGLAHANATNTPTVSYWVRVTAPAGSTALAPHEESIGVQSAMPAQTFSLRFDKPVSVSVQPRTSMNAIVTSYLRISSPRHSWVVEGDTTAPFTTLLPNDSSPNGPPPAPPGPLYDLLIVPLTPSDGSLTAAPMLISQSTAPLVDSAPLIDPGISIAGSVADANGPRAGVTVLLRAGPLPSTLGSSGSDGGFSVRARPGRFSAIILPPDGTALPDAHVDATASSWIDIPAPPAAAPTLSFAWARTGTRTLTARFTSAGDGAAASMDVRLDSADGALPNVGTLMVGTGALVATGTVRRRGTTDSTGSVSFTNLPAARYTVTALPAAASADGLTTSTADLTSAQAPSTVTVTLAPKVVVRGSLSNAPPNTQIIVLDDQPDLARAYAPVAVGAGGVFTIALDPGHAFHLLAQPPRDKGSRLPLGQVTTTTGPLDVGDTPWPNMVTVSGTVALSGSTTAVPGALVQAFCLGPGPDCLDYTDLASKDPLPLAESLVDATGAYSLLLPDPAVN